MKNIFIQAEIKNMELFTDTFRKRCYAAALQDDGKIDSEESKVLKKIDAATKKFVKELSKIH